MDWVGKSTSVCYCCVWKEGRVVCKYSIGTHEIDNMAALCLETIPPYHRFYLETIPFAFLMDDRFVYFAILRHSRGNSQLLSFLQNLRDEFTRIGRKGEFLPVVSGLVASLESVGTVVGAEEWPVMSNTNGDGRAGSSTKAPLLARHSKHDKKKVKDDGVGVRDIESLEHRQSTDSSEGHGHGMTTKSSSQNVRDKWCRQVRIILAIDAAVCILLLVIWLVICRGIECIR